MEYKQEFLITCQKDIEPLLISHWRELALYTDEVKLEPDFDRYKELEDLGKLKIFTLRDDGTLVGYLVVFEDNHLHYASTRWASSDVLYLKKEYRKMTFGAELISFAEQCLREDGVDVFMVGMKVHKPFDKLMTNLGYNPVERTYGKKL